MKFEGKKLRFECRIPNSEITDPGNLKLPYLKKLCVTLCTSAFSV